MLIILFALFLLGGYGYPSTELQRGRALASAQRHFEALAYFEWAVGNYTETGLSEDLVTALEELAGAQGLLRRHKDAANTWSRALSARIKLNGGSATLSELVMGHAMRAQSLKGARDYKGALAALEQSRNAANSVGGLKGASLGSILAMESELHDCMGEPWTALGSFEESLRLRGIYNLTSLPLISSLPIEERLLYYDLLQKVLREQPRAPASPSSTPLPTTQPPTFTSPDTLSSQAKLVGKSILRTGPYTNLLQLPKTFIPSLRSSPWHAISGEKALWGELTSSAAGLMVEARDSLAKEFQRLSAAGLLLEETECVHVGLRRGPPGISKNSSASVTSFNAGKGGGIGGGKWVWAATNGFWQELDEDGCASTTMPSACSLLGEIARTVPRLKIKRAGYSAISGETFLRPHCGWSNGQLKFHVGLKVPRVEGRHCSSITVGDETRHWEEGEVLMFDDSYLHEVSHECQEERVVFQLVIEHPDMRSPVKDDVSAGLQV